MPSDKGRPRRKKTTTELRLPRRPQAMEALSSCTQWSYSDRKKERCDCGRPCQECINRKSNCTYEAQDGLLSRIYRAPEAPVSKGFSSVGALADGESSDDECVRCQRRKLNCDKERPCYPCVDALGKCSLANCNYRRSDGVYELWAVRPFTLTV